MKVLTVTVVALGILVASFSALAQDAQKESFFADSVNRFIASSDHKASMMQNEGTSIRRDAAIASMKATFYKTHKKQLVNRMLSRDLETKRGVVDYFLVKSFYAFCEADLAMALADTFRSMTADGKSQTTTRVGKETSGSVQ